MDSIGDVIWRFFVLDGAALADPACLQADGGAQHLDPPPYVGRVYHPISRRGNLIDPALMVGRGGQ